MRRLLTDLFPICRSITGDGVRATLERVGAEIDLDVTEVPSGTPVLDWTVPDEWNITGAELIAPDGSTVVDFADHNLHVVSYSEPVELGLGREELDAHLHSLPDQPDLIPYKTSYYTRTWGFCLPDSLRRTLPDGEYAVKIDSRLEPGSLTYAEYVVPGTSTDEVLFSVHVCHPSLANDNLAGIAVATELARWLADQDVRYTYRFLFIPGTIGSITWLARNRPTTERVRHGMVLACLGDPGHLQWKSTRSEVADIDRIVGLVLASRGAHTIRPFEPWGYDERQFSSPGFDLPVGLLTRTPNGAYPEYHTSADDLAFVSDDALADSLAALRQIVGVIERNRVVRSLSPFGEPQLGRRGLYRTTGGSHVPDFELALLWVLNQADGTNSLLDIAERSGLGFEAVAAAADALTGADLLEDITT
ncbi:MAG: DUF4910 domain-containing protein [Acidimicrobiia bacterium]|nr:DUF4910 domain-containing protein [Acidimicrobiia bacterium]